MKWIKASEKTPEKDGYYITVCRYEDNDMVLPLTTSDTYFTNNEWKDTYGWEVIKWLDETDTDNADNYLEQINNIMWQGWGIKDYPFGRKDGEKIMKVLNEWAKQ